MSHCSDKCYCSDILGSRALCWQPKIAQLIRSINVYPLCLRYGVSGTFCVSRPKIKCLSIFLLFSGKTKKISCSQLQCQRNTKTSFNEIRKTKRHMFNIIHHTEKTRKIETLTTKLIQLLKNTQKDFSTNKPFKFFEFKNANIKIAYFAEENGLILCFL